MYRDDIRQAAFEHTLAQYGLLEKDADFRSAFGKMREAATQSMRRFTGALTNTPRAVTSPGVTRPMAAVAHTPPAAPSPALARTQPSIPGPVSTPTAYAQTQQAMYPPQSVFDRLRESKPLPPTSAREQYPHLFAQNPPIPHSGPAPKPRYSREEQIQMARGVMPPITAEQYGEMMAAQHGGSALEHAGQFDKIFGGRGKVAHYLLKTAARRRSQKKVAHYRLRSAA